MPRYTPFEKSFEELEAADLSSLKSAAEGWYVEYKREASKAEAMAKSVSAFANTHGGWLFYGITEKSKDEPVAGAFPGISRTDVDAALQRLRQAVANAVNPSPHYEARAIWGPDAQIGLLADYAVICVYVPKGPNSPYVHKSGQIYRRVADGSEPKPENDRFVLDQLWRRSDDVLSEYKDWIERDPEFSKAERDRPYIRLLMVADRWAERDAWLDAPFSEVRAILNAKQPTAYAIPFDTVYTTADGFIGRQLRDNNPHNLGLTYHLRRTLISELLIPVDLYNPKYSEGVRHKLKDYSQADRFCDILRAGAHDSPRVVDLNFVLNILMAVADLQDKILKRANWVNGYYCKAILLNAWRTIPFLDAPTVMQEYETHGVPMLLDGRIISRPGSHPNSFERVNNYEDVEAPGARLALQGLDMFWPIAQAYGIPTLSSEIIDKSPNFMAELLDLGPKAISAQSARKTRKSE